MSDTKNHLILFDGHCHLCNGSVKTILKYDHRKIFHFLPLQSNESLEILSRKKTDEKISDSIIYVRKEKILQKSEAVLWLASELNFPVNLVAGLIVFPPIIRNTVYDFIARNRYRWFGKSESCFIPDAEERNRFSGL